MDDLLPIIDERLARFVEVIEVPANLREAIGYSLLAPGKRIRPTLAIRSCEAVGGTMDAAVPAAIAIEMIHCFSLIHDDLPAMDDDDLRRGRPTSHRKFGEAMAILAGDALATLPYLTIVQSELTADLQSRLVGELADATARMISGQVYDLIGGFGGNPAPADRLETIHRHKTGALIRSACRVGAISGQADQAALERLTAYGEHLGLMFQIVDDLLDVTGTSEALGKTAGKDEAAGKLTWPAIHGVEGSRLRVEDLEKKAIALVDPFGRRGEPLREMARALATRTK